MARTIDEIQMRKTIGAVITADGTGERDGASRALQKIQGMTLAEYITVNFQRAGVKDIVIVAGSQEEQLKKQLKGFGVTFLQNESCEAGKQPEMLDSVKTGLSYLKERCSRVFICPVDVPFFQMETLEQLLSEEKTVVIPSYNHRGGHPVLLGEKIFSDVIAYEGTGGLRGALRSLGQNPVYVEMRDPGTVEPVLEGSGIQKKVAEAYQRNLKRAHVKVQLIHTKPYFGPGTVTLLRQIHRLGSVREASERTGISYSKAWSMIRTAEEESGLELVRRRPGGKFGGMAEVTDDCLELIRKYEELEKSAEQFVKAEYQRIFGEDVGKRRENPENPLT